jgi:hypothetical protein
MRHADGPEFNIVMPSYYYDVPDKFPVKRPNELNLVAIPNPARPRIVGFAYTDTFNG